LSAASLFFFVFPEGKQWKKASIFLPVPALETGVRQLRDLAKLYAPSLLEARICGAVRVEG
jgi:hypothetical protein